MPAGLLLALALAAPPPWPGAEPVPDPPPLAGTVRIGADARDPDGGAPWAVRSWRIAAREGSGQKQPACLQVGRHAGDGLVRGERTLGFSDRVVCADRSSHFIDEAPFAVERLAVDGKLTRTLVAGLVDREVRRVELTVRGRVRRLPARSDRRPSLRPRDVA